MRLILLNCLLCLNLVSHSQNENLTAYLVPGMGTDYRMFETFDLGSEVIKKTIKWPENPEQFKGLSRLAKEISSQIDTTEKFVLIGVSMGGMLSMELAQMINPECIILISSVRSSKEIPLKYKIGRILPIHKLLSEKGLEKRAKKEKTFREINDSNMKILYPKMLRDCGADFLKWQMSSIVNWKFKEDTSNCRIFHCHGDKDRVLPLTRKSQPTSIIEGGTHKMIVNRREEISELIKSYLAELN